MLDQELSEGYQNSYDFPASFEDPNEQSFTYGDEDFDTNELTYSQTEVREKTVFAVAVSAGTTQPWQTTGLDGHYTVDKDRVIIWGSGASRWRYVGRKASIDFELTADARSSALAYRWYLTNSVPFYVQFGLGYAYWSGSINPAGVVGKQLSQDEEGEQPFDEGSLDSGDVFRSSFTAHGPTVSLNAGFAYTFGSGWFIEYSLFGVGKSWTGEPTLTAPSTHAKSAVKDSLVRFVSWELLNFKVGRSF